MIHLNHPAGVIFYFFNIRTLTSVIYARIIV